MSDRIWRWWVNYNEQYENKTIMLLTHWCCCAVVAAYMMMMMVVVVVVVVENNDDGKNAWQNLKKMMNNKLQ